MNLLVGNKITERIAELCLILALVVPIFLIPISELKHYHRGLITLLLLPTLLFIPKKNEQNISLYEIVLWLFTLLIFTSSLWANLPSHVWDRGANWIILLLGFRVGYSTNWKQLKFPFWDYLCPGLLLFNLCMICYFFIDVSFQDGVFNYSQYDMNQIGTYFGGNSNYISSSLTILLFATIASNQFFGKKGLLYLVLFAVTIGVILLFNARGSSLALIACLALTFFSIGRVHLKKLIVPLGFLAIIFGSFLFILEDKERFFNQYSFVRSLSEDSTDDRIKIWEKSFTMFSENWLTGVGSGNWQYDIHKYGAENYSNGIGSTWSYGHAHNMFIEHSCELGIFGLLLLLFILIYPLISGKLSYSNGKKQLIIVLVCYALLSAFYGVVYELNYCYFPLQMIWIGVIGFLIQEEGLSVFQLSKKVVTLLISGLLLVSIFWAYQGFHNFREYQKLARLVGNEKFEKALAVADQISQTGSHRYRRKIPLDHYKSEIYFKTGEYEKALLYIDKAIKDFPYSHELWHKKALAEASLDKINAILSWKKSLQLNPNYLYSLFAFTTYSLESNSLNLLNAKIGLDHLGKNFFNEMMEKYNDDIWIDPSKKEINTWTTLCNQLDKYLVLEEKYWRLYKVNNKGYILNYLKKPENAKTKSNVKKQ